jgi:hypothetical protein
MTDNVVPLPPRFPSAAEPFVPEPAVFPYSDAAYAAKTLLLVSKTAGAMNVRSYVDQHGRPNQRLAVEAAYIPASCKLCLDNPNSHRPSAITANSL